MVPYVLKKFLEEKVSTLITDALQGQSQAAQAVNSFANSVTTELQTSTISSTFLQGATSFLGDTNLRNALQQGTALQFFGPATSFLSRAVAGNWSDPSFVSFADAGASLLEAICSDGLANTSFANTASLFLDQVIAQGAADTAFAHGALSFLEDAVSDGLTNSSPFLANSFGIGDFLQFLAQASGFGA
jgi:hypothetical protein